MLRVGVRWDELEWRDQLDVVESVLADSEGSIDRTLDSIDDQIAEMFPEEETWGSSPGAMRAQRAAEQAWGGLPRAGQSPNAASRPQPAPTPPTPRQVVRAGHPLEGPLFFLIQRAFMAIPRPPPPPTITPE